MNLILFEPAETTLPLPREDRRAIHLLDVLRRREGDLFDAGIVNGPRGKGTLRRIEADGLRLEFAWESPPPALDPITLIVGLPRPQTARAILRDLASLGVSSMHFVTTEKGDLNYGSSTLWHGGEYRRHLVSGAEQAFCTRIPTITFGQDLRTTISQLPLNGTRVALDNYEASSPLSGLAKVETNVAVAVGPERGWSGKERDWLRDERFTLVHVGARVLRTETACIVAVALLKARLGSI